MMINDLPQTYRMKVDEKGNIIFVKNRDVQILGRSIEEICKILCALDMEKITGIEMTMDNLVKYKELIDKENRKAQEEIINNMLKNFNKEFNNMKGE